VILIGNFNSNVEYEDGQLVLKYVSGNNSCNQRQKYSVTILFTCHHNKRGVSGPEYLPHQSTECSHRFEWPSSHACLPFRFEICSQSAVSDKLNEYVLRPRNAVKSVCDAVVLMNCIIKLLDPFSTLTLLVG